MDKLLDHLSCEQVGIVAWMNQAISGSIFGDGTRLVSAATGALAELLPDLRLCLPDGPDAMGGVIGSGCGPDSKSASTKAVFETLERYACAVYAADEVISASGNELGSSAMPGLGQGYDPTVPIRWVPGYHLIERRAVWVPLVMAHIFVEPDIGEHFHSGTTAGVAAHSTLEAAVVAAWHEVIEREAVEAIWRLQLPLPRIEAAFGSSELFDGLRRCDAHAFVDQRYYDATNDLDVPIVYGVRRLSLPLAIDTIVSCAAGQSLFAALAKVRLDAAGQQVMRLHASRGAPYFRFTRETEPDFSFLGEGPARVAHAPDEPEPSLAAISGLRDRFAALRRDVILINLTPDELVGLGVHVVRVLIPSLMQLSASPDQRRRFHPRLAEIAAYFGDARDPYRSTHSAQPFL